MLAQGTAMPIVSIILFGAFAVFFWWVVAPGARRSAAVKRRAREVMSGRQSMTSQQFSVAFFGPNQRDTAKAVKDLLAKALIIDSSTIHPDDRLIADLGLAKVDGLDLNFLIEE